MIFAVIPNLIAFPTALAEGLSVIIATTLAFISPLAAAFAIDSKSLPLPEARTATLIARAPSIYSWFYPATLIRSIAHRFPYEHARQQRFAFKAAPVYAIPHQVAVA